MNNHLLIPGQTPPQIDDDAFRAIASRIETDGLPKVATNELNLLQEQHPPLAIYLDIFGSDLNDVAAELWPERTLKLGAALAMGAYRESGYVATVDERAFEIGHFAAEMDGIPDTYSRSLPEDPKLLHMALVALETPVFDESQLSRRHSGGYEQVFNIGAGCARYFLQQAILG